MLSFAGGQVALPDALTCSNRTGDGQTGKQIGSPEKLPTLERMSDGALLQLASDLSDLLELEQEAGADAQLVGYIRLVSKQCSAELGRRCG